MANSWLRLWHDMPTDPKWRTISKISKQRIGDVISVYLHILVNASTATDRGRTKNLQSDDIASALDLETENVDQILAAMQGKVLEGDKVSGWEKRQPKREDGSAERSKKNRELKKNEETAIDRNRPQPTTKNRPDTDTDTDINLSVTNVTDTSKNVVVLETQIKPTTKSVLETELQAACRETWARYGNCYFNRYGTEPVRNAKVNSAIKSFVQRIGARDSPEVAAFFVESNAAYYVQRGHTVDCLLHDAEKLRTEWATGHSMTTTRARQIDRTQTNKSVVSEAMKILEGMNHGKTA